MCRPCPPSLEERLQQLQAFRRQEALGNLDPMVEQFRVGDAELAANSAEAQMAGAKYEPPQARLHGGARAHCARLQGHVQSPFFQAIVPDGGGGVAQRQDLGVRGRIHPGDGRIAAPANDSAAHGHDRADGQLARALGLAGQRQRFAHELFVAHLGQCTPAGYSRAGLPGRRRTTLAVPSIGASLCLPGLLVAMCSAFCYAGPSPAQTLFLVTSNRVSLALPMPMFCRDNMRQAPGMCAIGMPQWLGGTCKDSRDPKNFLARVTIGPDKPFAM